MFKVLTPTLLAMGAFLAGQGAPSPAPAAPPAVAFAPARLSIQPSGKLNLGELGPLEKKSQRYTFTNTSTAPITLRVFDLSPGVTVEGGALQGPIAAKASAELILQVDPAGWVGHQSRNVRLGTDDPHQGNYYLPLEMRVRPDLAVDGDRRDLGDVAVSSSPQAVFTFTRETGAPVVLTVTQAPPPYLELDLQQGRNTAQLAYTLRTDRIPPGVLLGFERIAVTTNAPMQPTFDLYLSWKLHHAVDATPSRLVFADGAKASLVLTLKGHAGAPFRILEAKVEGEGFRVDPPSEGPVAEQALTVHRLGKAQAQAQAMLVLRFEGEDRSLKVPLVYIP